MLQPWEYASGSQGEDQPRVPRSSLGAKSHGFLSAAWPCAAWLSCGVSCRVHVLFQGLTCFRVTTPQFGALHVHICLKQDMRRSYQSGLIKCTAKPFVLTVYCICNTFTINNLPEIQSQGHKSWRFIYEILWINYVQDRIAMILNTEVKIFFAVAAKKTLQEETMHKSNMNVLARYRNKVFTGFECCPFKLTIFFKDLFRFFFH